MKIFANFALDAANECLWREGAQIAMQPKPFAVLSYLVENPGRLITQRELLDALWPKTFVQAQVLRTYMLELRKILGDDAGQPRFIQTLPKRGYRFVAPVTEAPPARNGPEGCTEQAGLFDRAEDITRLELHLGTAESGQRRIILFERRSERGALAEAADLLERALRIVDNCCEAGEEARTIRDTLAAARAALDREKRFDTFLTPI